MSFPRYFLISRKLLTERPELVTNALRSFTVSSVLVASAEDAALAKVIAEEVIQFTKLIGVVADFEIPLQTINEDGSVEDFAPVDEQQTETPLIHKVN